MHYIMTLARWMARKAVRAEWKSRGRNPHCADASVIAAYFVEHRNELLKEAWDHPVAQQYRHQEQMKLARKAVVAEIREKGRKVNSIDPAELNKLIESYLNEHPWESAIREIECA